MKPRYYPRALANASVVFTGNGFTGEGQLVNATVPGCLIQSGFTAKKGDSLTLRLTFPLTGDTFLVAQAVVRWVAGFRFGVEFIQMSRIEQVRYKALVNDLLKFQTPSHAPSARKRFSHQPGGVNWHLTEYGV